MLDTKQANNVRVALRLKLNTSASVDQQDGEIRVRRSSRHIARVLLMARSISKNEFSLNGTEIPIRNIDGDALLPFSAQAIGEKSEFEVAAGSTLYCVQLVFVDAVRIVE